MDTINGNLNNNFTSSNENVIEEVIEPITEQVVEDKPILLNEELEQNNNVIEEQANEEIVEQVQEQANEEVVEEIQEQANEDIIEQVQEQPNEEIVEEIQEQANEEVVEEIQEQANEEVVEEIQEQANEEIIEQVQEQSNEEIVEEIQEQANEEVVEEIQEQPNEEIIEQVQEQANEDIIEQVQEQANEEVVEEIQEQPNEEVVEELEEHVENGNLNNIDIDELFNSIEADDIDKLFEGVGQINSSIIKELQKVYESINQKINDINDTKNSEKAKLEAINEIARSDYEQVKEMTQQFIGYKDTIANYEKTIRENVCLLKELKAEMNDLGENVRTENLPEYIQDLKIQIQECKDLKSQLGDDSSSIDELLNKIKSLKSEYEGYLEAKSNGINYSVDAIKEEANTIRASKQQLNDIVDTIDKLKNLDVLSELRSLIDDVNISMTKLSQVKEDIKDKTIMELFVENGCVLPLNLKRKTNSNIFKINKIVAIDKGCIAMGDLIIDGEVNEKYREFATNTNYTYLH